MKIRAWLLLGIVSMTSTNATATTLGQRVEIRMAEEKVVLCLSHGDFKGPHDVYIYAKEPPNEYKTVALEHYSDKCLLLDPVRLLGKRHSGVLYIAGGAGGRKFMTDLAISCDRAKAQCDMFLPREVFSTQPRKEYEELQKLYERAREAPEAKR